LQPSELIEAMRHAARLLRAYPAHWLGVSLLFLLGIEALMLVPYIGFVAKVAVAGLLSAQSLVLFDRADAGEQPPVGRLFEAWSLPLGAQAALVGSALLPFAAGLAVLAAQGPDGHAGFFFGRLGTPQAGEPPSSAQLLVFKLVMHGVSVWLTFVAAAVLMLGRRGGSAILHGLWLAHRNPLALALLLGFALGFEAVSALLPQVLPPGLALLVALGLLLGMIAWSLALQYTLSLRAILREHALKATDDARIGRGHAVAPPNDDGDGDRDPDEPR
jgi:hypothetical protein